VGLPDERLEVVFDAGLMIPLELVLALEQRGRPNKRGRVHTRIDRIPGSPPGAMFGGRCQGMCPMCRAPVGRMLAPPPIRANREDNMPLIQVKLIEGVFTSSQKKEIVERLTDAMVEIEGENLRQYTWCLVEEVASGEWGFGGQTPTADDVKALARGEVAAT
jgi:4-oxalocrotonate tautomerase